MSRSKLVLKMKHQQASIDSNNGLKILFIFASALWPRKKKKKRKEKKGKKIESRRL